MRDQRALGCGYDGATDEIRNAALADLGCEVHDSPLSQRDPERKLSCHFTGIGHLGVRLRCSVFDWTTYLFRSFDLPSILLPA